MKPAEPQTRMRPYSALRATRCDSVIASNCGITALYPKQNTHIVANRPTKSGVSGNSEKLASVSAQPMRSQRTGRGERAASQLHELGATTRVAYQRLISTPIAATS